jgi:hypothetical protein
MRGLGPRRPLAVGWAALALSLASGCAEAPGSSISEDAAERGRQRASSAPAGASAGRRSTQERGFQIVQVLPRRSIVLRARPGGRALRRLRSRTEFGSRRFLGVAATDGPWLGVVSAERPNGRLGWIDGRSDALKTVWTDVSLRVDLSRRVLEVRDGTRTTRRVLVGVGREGYPTPTGRFAVTDKLRNGFGPSYGCCIVALSGHQTRLPPGWPGGDRLAVHGTPSPESIGKAASTGCLRAGERDMRSLLRTVPLGAPVFIER